MILPLVAVFAWSEAQQNPKGLARPGTALVPDQFTPLAPDQLHLDGGFLGTRFEANEKGRLLVVSEDDLLDCFEHREKPHQDWQGEHVGKFLHAATLAWQATGDKLLRQKIARVVARLLPTQEADGYFGTYPKEKRWTSWDVWVHKYVLIGLLTYFQYSRDERALMACERIGDLLVRTFGTGTGQKDINTAGEHKGLAATSILEPMLLLYRATADPRYLKFAQYVVGNYDSPAGSELLSGLERTKSVLGPKSQKAYEMTSNLSGLVETYRANKDSRLLDDALIAWTDISSHRLYPTGSGSTHELWPQDGQFPENADAQICETCVSVTWEQFNMQLLRLLGDGKFGDQIEDTVYNHLLGAQKPSGEAWAYYTPLAGKKPYSPQTTCCLSSGPRGIALLTSLAMMTSADGGIVVNLYNRGNAEVPLPKGKVGIRVATDYPEIGKVSVKLTLPNEMAFPLRLRIPSWAVGAAVSLNGQTLVMKSTLTDGYALLNRTWKTGDEVELDFPMQVRRLESKGRVAFAYGPMILALDSDLNASLADPNTVAVGDALPTPLTASQTLPGDLRFQLAAGSETYVLRPFAFAGAEGGQFSVWLKKG